MSDTPTILNMIVCDGVHRDPGSGKWSLLGLFNSINSGGFPTTHPQFFVYLALAGANGKVPLRFQIVASDRKDEPLYKMEAELTVADPSVVADMVLPFQRVTFTKAGKYLIQVFANNNYVGEREFTAALTAKA